MWRASDECPGNFLDHYQPLAGRVNFVTEPPSPEEALGDGVRCVGKNDYHERCKGLPAREALCWAALRPRDEVVAAVAANVARCGGGPFLALHVRRTDHFALAMRRETTTDDFLRFCWMSAKKKIIVENLTRSEHDYDRSDLVEAFAIPDEVIHISDVCGYDDSLSKEDEARFQADPVAAKWFNEPAAQQPASPEAAQAGTAQS